VNVLKETNTSK